MRVSRDGLDRFALKNDLACAVCDDYDNPPYLCVSECIYSGVRLVRINRTGSTRAATGQSAKNFRTTVAHTHDACTFNYRATEHRAQACLCDVCVCVCLYGILNVTTARA